MPNQTISITLTWGPAQGQLSDYDLNQLGTLLASHLSAAVEADVTFIPQLVNNPAAFDTQLIFNITQRLFQGWDAGSGKYMPVTEYGVGDVKNSYAAADDIARGWVLLNGRVISSIPGITGAQQQSLANVFHGGVLGGSLPTVTPANVTGLPTPNSFGSIPWPPSLAPVVQPPPGAFSPDLTFSATVTAAEAQAMADLAETLRTSTDDAFTVTKQIQAVAEAFLNAMNNSNQPTLYAFVFCGYP